MANEEVGVWILSTEGVSGIRTGVDGCGMFKSHGDKNLFIETQ